MRRRDLIAMLGGAAAFLPSATLAVSSRPRLAIRWTTNARPAEGAALRDGLKSLGYVEGQTIDIDERHSDGDSTRLPGLAQELLRSKPDVTLANAPASATAMHGAAPALPIVCPTFGPDGLPSLATSYAHPGGSVTGLSIFVEGMFGKLVELVLDTIPGAAAIGLLMNPGNPGNLQAPIARQQIVSAAQARGLSVVIGEAATREGIRPAFQRLAAAKVQAAIVPNDALFIAQVPLLIEAQLASHVPLIFTNAPFVKAGGLAGYGVDAVDNFRRAAVYIDKILRGASPANLPIEFPTKFELAVNLKTAKALGVAIPPTLLARADEVFE